MGRDGARTIRLRVLANRGTYPNYSVELPGHLLRCSEELVWSAVLTGPDPTLDQSDVAVLCREEVQLYGAALLAVDNPSNHQFLSFEPGSWGHSLPAPAGAVDLRAPEIRRMLEAAIPELVERSRLDEWAGAGGIRKSIHFPVGPHVLVPQGSAAECAELIEAIDLEDELCLRGLSKLLAASSLRAYPWYIEEAALAAYISLEAALTMIRQHVAHEAGTEYWEDVPFREVFDFIERTFPKGVALADFLQELHEIRTMLVHPASQFGEHWTPPMLTDDCWEAFECLIALYRLLLLGEVWTQEDS